MYLSYNDETFLSTTATTITKLGTWQFRLFTSTSISTCNFTTALYQFFACFRGCWKSCPVWCQKIVFILPSPFCHVKFRKPFINCSGSNAKFAMTFHPTHASTLNVLNYLFVVGRDYHIRWRHLIEILNQCWMSSWWERNVTRSFRNSSSPSFSMLLFISLLFCSCAWSTLMYENTLWIFLPWSSLSWKPWKHRRTL
jgi:hypothetical protein